MAKKTLKKRRAKVRNSGQEILDGLREINAGKVGRVINRPDVGKVREKTGLSQARFAELLGVSRRAFNRAAIRWRASFQSTI